MRESNLDPLVAARNREQLYAAIDAKIRAQARYVVERDRVVVPSQQDPRLRGNRGGGDEITPALPDGDPGKEIAYRWRRSYCVQTPDGTAIEPTLLAEMKASGERWAQGGNKKTKSHAAILKIGDLRAGNN